MNYSIKDIQTHSLDVKSKISNKEFKEYLYSSLELNNIEYSNETFIHISFLENISQYQIILFSKSFEYTTIDLFKCFYTKDSNTNNIDVFLANKFFVIYKQEQFYYVQKIDYEVNKEDLKNYIQKMLKITVHNIYEISVEALVDLEEKYKNEYKNTNLVNINIKKDRSFLVYLLYIKACIVFCLVYFFFEQNSSKNVNLNLISQNQKEYKKFIKDNSFKSISKDFDLIVSNINKHKLKLNSFEYKKSYITLSFESKNKNDIYAFLDLYKKRLSKNHISVNTENKIFRCICDVRLN